MPGISVERWTRAAVVFVGAGALAIALLAFGPFIFSDHVVDKLTALFIYVIMAVMWNALAGYAGQMSVGQQAFFGLGAYATIITSEAGLGAYTAIIVGALLGGAAALPMSVFLVRLKGGEFAIATWVVAVVVHLLVNLDRLIQGETGRSLIALNVYSGAERLAYTYWLALAAMTVSLIAIFVILRSPLGAMIQAIRDDEAAATSVGVRVIAGKYIIFVVAAFGCAAAGALWLATSVTFQPKTYFGIQWTAFMIFMVLVGGLGTFEGPIVGAVLFFAIQELAGEAGVWYLVGLGAAAVIFALFIPQGIWGVLSARLNLRLLPVDYRLRVEERDPST